ncbi:protease family c26 gamma-glutamyl hydrolase [Anaeramoeba flamelloides]|uniref:folate gamma-glutamyl hydrolase n=1 Tax=Anaeramoeba flamelloides TaxID=1746091 RepID=A0AAV7ZIH0_9EUKA|nr:protease family c26 gamma-glutamyl hydrolase [Anaeramoeba flamelloides]
MKQTKLFRQTFTFLFFFLLIFVQLPDMATCLKKTQTPIIGVLTQESTSRMKHYGNQFIASSTVQWLSSAGARVIPIYYDINIEVLDEVLDQVNGVVIPSGGIYLQSSEQEVQHFPLYVTLRKIVEIAKEKTDKGDAFPIFSFGNGMYSLMKILSENKVIEEHVEASDLSVDLKVVAKQDALKTSQLFEAFSSYYIINDDPEKNSGDVGGENYDAIENQIDSESNLKFWMDQEFAITKKQFQGSQELKNFFHLLQTTKDRKGKEIVASIEAKNYPFFGIGWMPDKSAWEIMSTKKQFCHTQDCIIISQNFAHLIVRHAKKNNQKIWSSKEELKRMIQGTSIFETKQQTDNKISECYFFELSPQYGKSDASLFETLTDFFSILGLTAGLVFFYLGIKVILTSNAFKNLVKNIK